MTFAANFERHPGGERQDPAAEARSGDRRGPFRPNQLVPTRARLQGRVVAQLAQVADIAALLATSLAVHHLAGVEAAMAIAGALATLAALSLFKAYGFGRREKLAAHLGRVLVALRCV